MDTLTKTDKRVAFQARDKQYAKPCGATQDVPIPPGSIPGQRSIQSAAVADGCLLKADLFASARNKN